MAIRRSQCGGCSTGCGIRAITGEDRALIVEGDTTHPANAGLLCVGARRIEAMADLSGRLLHPAVQGRRQTWERGMALTAQRLKAVLARHGPGSVALHVGDGLLTEDLYVANKLFKGFLGSAHVQATGVGPVAGAQRLAFGEDVMPAALEDIGRADLIVLAGDALTMRQPVWLERVRMAGERGARLCVLAEQPGGTDGPGDLTVPIRRGSAARLMTGLLVHLHAAGVLDRDALEQRVVLPVDFWPRVAGDHDLWSVARACGLTPAAVRDFYDLWTGADRVVTLYPDDHAGLAAAVINLHLATGRIGRAGAAPFAVAALANGMGVREVGCTCDQHAAHRDFTAEALSDTARFWGGRAMAEAAGLAGDALLEAMRAGRVKALWSLGDAAEDAAWLAEARAAVGFSIRSTTREDALGEEWSVVLPSPVWAEKDGTLTSMDRLVSRHRRLFDLPGEARPDWWALTRLAQAMGWGDAFHYERPADIYREHARLTAYRNEGRYLLNLRRHAPVSNPAYDELTPWRWGEVPFQDGRFPTKDGKARLVIAPGQADAIP
jgi:assimilatory nitrate reductase catalytic subunit